MAGSDQKLLSTPSAQLAATECEQGGFADLVGQDDSVFEVMDLADNVRLIYPNMAVTQDYRADRINVDIDTSGTITRVWCG